MGGTNQIYRIYDYPSPLQTPPSVLPKLHFFEMKLCRHFSLYGLVIARVRPQCYQRLDSDKGHGFKHDGRTGGGYVGGVRCRGSSRFRRGGAETRQKGGQKCAVFSFFLLLNIYPER